VTKVASTTHDSTPPSSTKHSKCISDHVESRGVWHLLAVAATGSIKGEVVADSSDSVPQPSIWQMKLSSPFSQ
jgi:hypothetical protein